MTVRVTAILVTHDGQPWLPTSVTAITTQTRPVDRIVAVDTGSLDNSVSLLRGAGIHVIEVERDTGFGEAVNVAIEATPPFIADGAQDQEWLWILHDDCAPSKDALEKLLAAVENKPQVALAGPKLRGWHDRKHLLELGVSIATNGARWTGMEYREQDQGQHDDERDVLSVSTAAMLVRRDVFTELSGFDPNLSLFRDDVDFGWRLRTAGFSALAVPEAIAFHGEAAASERRSIDVKDAILHRPLLLDRRHAAYVLLANASLFYLPLLGIQLLLSSLVRAFGYLLAKLPGYAADEIAAVALVLIKPQKIFAARKVRRSQRLVSGSNIRAFLPPRGVQIRLAYDRARSALDRFLSTRIKFHSEEEQRSMLDLNDEALESEEILVSEGSRKLREVLLRPFSLAIVAILTVTLIGSRNRLGAISGGALLDAPSSGIDLFSKYLESWHPIALGSSSNTPTWVFLIGFASLLTWTNIKLFLALFFLLAIPAAIWICYKFTQRFTKSKLIALIAALLYGFSPPIIYAISEGSLGILVIALLAPLILQSFLEGELIEKYSWRKISAHVILYGVVLAFSPPAFILISLFHFFTSARQVLLSLPISTSHIASVQWGLPLERVYKRSALLLGAIAVNIPWSLELITYPSRSLLDPGITLEGGAPWQLIFANPSQSWWLFSLAPILVLIAAFRYESREKALLALFILGVAITLSFFFVNGHASASLVRPNLGSIAIIFSLAALVSGITLLEGLIPEIRNSALNFRHFATAAVAISAILSLAFSLIWWIGPGANGGLARGSKFSVPEFITANASTDERYKSLLLRSKNGRLVYSVIRDRQLQLGDADLIYGGSKVIDEAVAGLVSGSAINANAVLGSYGIRYLFLAQPVKKGLARTIDGIGGFTRASSTDAGIVWKVVGASSRVSLIPFDAISSSSGEEIALAAEEVDARGTITRTGVIRIGERFDGRWRLLVNNRSLKLSRSIDGLPQFEVTEPGDFYLYHDGTTRRGWVSLQLIVFLTLLTASLPARRRRAEVPIEELA
jgi:GT2 family glycosyltransferase